MVVEKSAQKLVKMAKVMENEEISLDQQITLPTIGYQLEFADRSQTCTKWKENATLPFALANHAYFRLCKKDSTACCA